MIDSSATPLLDSHGRWPSRASCMVVPIVGLSFVPQPRAVVSFFALGAFALLGRLQALQALALLCLYSICSKGAAPEVSSNSSLRFIALVIAATSVPLRGGRRLHVFPLTTSGLGIVLLVHSLLFSTLPEVSTRKAFSGTLSAVAIVSGWIRLTEAQCPAYPSSYLRG